VRVELGLLTIVLLQAMVVVMVLGMLLKRVRLAHATVHELVAIVRELMWAVGASSTREYSEELPPRVVAVEGCIEE
jgi:hypothetical protein